jgi:hypothetical protein
MNGDQFLDSDDALLIIKAFAVEQLDAYQPRMVDVEVWDPVLFARYQRKSPYKFKRSYKSLACKFHNWVERGKQFPFYLIAPLMEKLESEEEDCKKYWFLGRMVLDGPNGPTVESNGSSEEQEDEGGGLLTLVSAPPAINAAPSDDGWEIVELADASDDDGCS